MEFELLLWLVDGAVTGSIPQDVAELGSRLYEGRASSSRFGAPWTHK